MWRSAGSRFGVLMCAALLACGGSQSAGDGTLSNRGAGGGGESADMTAAYWCSITSDGYEYPPMACVVRRVDGKYQLEKLSGSQRIRGVVKPRGSDGGFSFDGEFYCPFGDCTQELHGVFAPQSDGKLRGTFGDKGIVVTMTRTDMSAFGGNGYGGAAYGGAAYGGAAYGGMPYGGGGPNRIGF